MICREVGLISSFTAEEQACKDEWEMRRAVHFKKLKRNEKKTQKCGTKGEAPEDELDLLQDPWWRGLIIATGILVLGLIIACRGKARA